MAYTYPTAEGIKFAMEQGWSKEQAERGFDIFDFDGLGIYGIEAICDAHVDKREDGTYYVTESYDDEEAAREAERIGFCKIIPTEEIPETFILNDFYGWVDTPENRKKIKEISDYYANH